MTKIEVGKEYNHNSYSMGSAAGYRKVVYVGSSIVVYEDYDGKECSVALTTASERWENKKVKHKQVVYANLYRNKYDIVTPAPGTFKKNREDVCDVADSTFVGVGTITIEWEE